MLASPAVSRWIAAVVSAAVALGACRSSSDLAPPGGRVDAGADAFVAPSDAKDAACVSHFGTAITQAFGRLDGTIHAVIPPNDHRCAGANDNHVQIEVESGGAYYRLFVNVQSDQGPPDVLVDEVDAPLVGPAWSDGWHPGLLLDYPSQLGVHSDAFVVAPMADLVPRIDAMLELGAPISVFASSSTSNSDSAHLVHRNPTNHDGAIVLRPDAATPHWFLVRFDEQSF